MQSGLRIMDVDCAFHAFAIDEIALAQDHGIDFMAWNRRFMRFMLASRIDHAMMHVET
jgi:hypothetical protein